MSAHHDSLPQRATSLSKPHCGAQTPSVASALKLKRATTTAASPLPPAKPKPTTVSCPFCHPPNTRGCAPSSLNGHIRGPTHAYNARVSLCRLAGRPIPRAWEVWLLPAARAEYVAWCGAGEAGGEWSVARCGEAVGKAKGIKDVGDCVAWRESPTAGVALLLPDWVPVGPTLHSPRHPRPSLQETPARLIAAVEAGRVVPLSAMGSGSGSTSSISLLAGAPSTTDKRGVLDGPTFLSTELPGSLLRVGSAPHTLSPTPAAPRLRVGRPIKLDVVPPTTNTEDPPIFLSDALLGAPLDKSIPPRNRRFLAPFADAARGAYWGGALPADAALNEILASMSGLAPAPTLAGTTITELGLPRTPTSKQGPIPNFDDILAGLSGTGLVRHTLDAGMNSLISACAHKDPDATLVNPREQDVGLKEDPSGEPCAKRRRIEREEPQTAEMEAPVFTLPLPEVRLELLGQRDA